MDEDVNGKKNLHELSEGLIDEDERDEDGEDFLSEAGDESDQEAAFHGHDDDHDHHQPHPHPDTAHNVFDVVRLAELIWDEQKKVGVSEKKYRNKDVFQAF